MEIHHQETTGSSSFHFNSFLGLLTSDDDDDDDADTDLQDTYIEIALQPPQILLPPTPPQLQHQQEIPLNDHEEELQLRISFSSRVFPFPGQSSSCSSDGVHGNNNSCHDDQAISSDNLHTQGTPKTPTNRLLGFFPSNFNISTTRSWELLVGSRGEANYTSTATGRSGGVVGNFLVKLRAATFQMMMDSLLKLREFTSSSSADQMSRRDIHQLKPRNAQMLIVKPFKKLMGRMQNIPREMERSKVTAVINLKGRRLDGGGVFRAISSRKGRENKTKSSPPSVRSSPSKKHFCYELGGGGSSRSQDIHSARDNSVQAAIAHCKKSLGGADDFHF